MAWGVAVLEAAGDVVGRGTRTLGYWKRHQIKELEAVLGEFHEAGWAIDDPPKYYRVRCPCGQHYRWIHLTPSGTKYARDVLRWLYRQTCYPEGGQQSE